LKKLLILTILLSALAASGFATVSFTTTSLPAGQVGKAYSATMTATGGTAPYKFTVPTGLPNGTYLLSSGALGGTPVSAGTYSFTITVKDSSYRPQSVSKSFSIAVAPVTTANPLAFTTTSLPSGTVGTAYSATMAATGGTAPYKFTVPSGLPLGTALMSSGALSGTPTTACNCSFTITVTDSSATPQKVSKVFSIAVAAVTSTTTPVSFTTTSLPSGTVGTAYSATMAATGGTAPYKFTVPTGLPLGTSLMSNGALSGTPTTACNCSFTITVTDSSATPQKVSKVFSIAVATAATTTTPVSFTTASLPSGTAGTAYSATLAATGGTAPYKFTVPSGLPSGLSLASSGTLSGTPTTAGTSSFTATVTDSSSTPQTASKTLSITIAAAAPTVTPLSVSTSSLPAVTMGSAYSTTLAATGGTSPYKWSIASGSLPAGLTLSSAGTISGTPTASGNVSFTVEVTDSESTPATATAIESIDVTASSSLTAPSQAANAGYTSLAFNSDFSKGLSLSNTGTGAGYSWYNSGIWYESAATGASTPNNNNGVLNLPWNPGQSAPTTTVATMASNGENNTSWTHGYIEVSMAFPPVTGIWPALWLENNTATTSYVPTSSSVHDYGELDIMEWQSQIPNTFSGHIHDWTNASGSLKDAQNNNSNSTANFPSGTNLANFNTYGILWTPTQISWYFNNKLLFTATSSQYPEAFAQFNSGPMYLMLGNQTGTNWGGSGSVSPSAATNMTVQWVHVWQ